MFDTFVAMAVRLPRRGCCEFVSRAHWHFHVVESKDSWQARWQLVENGMVHILEWSDLKQAH